MRMQAARTFLVLGMRWEGSRIIFGRRGTWLTSPICLVALSLGREGFGSMIRIKNFEISQIEKNGSTSKIGPKLPVISEKYSHPAAVNYSASTSHFSDKYPPNYAATNSSYSDL